MPMDVHKAKPEWHMLLFPGQKPLKVTHSKCSEIWGWEPELLRAWFTEIMAQHHLVGT